MIYASSFGTALETGSAELDAFSEGYRTTFLAAGIAMVAAALVGYFLIAAAKKTSCPHWENEDDAEAVHAH